MERKFLKDLGIESDSIDKILDQASADIGKHKTLADTAQANAQQLAQDIVKRDADIAALKSVDAADLQSKLDALQAQYDAELESRKQQNAQRVQADRRTAFFSDVAFASDYAKRGVMAEFDEKAFPYSETDNSFPGAKEWLAQLQVSAPAVFGAQAPPPAVVRDTQAAAPPTLTKDAFAKMGYVARVALKASDPELYKTLKE